MPAIRTFLAAAAALALSTGTAHAKPVTDCPLRNAPFSENSPLIDIMLSPAARAAVEKELGVSFDQAPPQFFGTKAPTFAAILTLKEGAGMMGRPPEAVARAAAALKEVPVTEADKVARCVRYDDEKPEFDLPEGKPALLVFEKITGFKDVPSFEAARKTLKAMASENGWAIVFSDKGGAMSPEILSRFDAVIWNNISGDVLTLSQRKAFRAYIENGGGFVGIHGSGGDPAYFWDWYADTLVGARFAGHPRNPQFQEARVLVNDTSHPAARDLPDEWRMTDEWYAFKSNPRDGGARIVLSLDEGSYDPNAGFPVDLSMGAEHPIAWSKIIGKGRSFYSAIGHVPDAYEQPEHRALLEDAIAWVARMGDCECAD